MDAIRDLLDDSEEEWDFTLPQITAPKELVSDSQFSSNGCYTPYDSDGYTSPVPKGFSLDDLVGAIQGGEALGNIRKYLTLSDKQIVGGLAHSGKLNGLVEEIPAFFYVVATLNADLVRLWAKYGGDVNITHGDGHKRVPLLAFAIAMGGSFANDSTLVVKTLLSLGAAVEVIPRALFTPLERDLPDDGLPAEELLDVQDNGKQWFTPGVQKRIVQNLNFSFSQRYVLNLASHLGSFSRRKKQVAAVYDTESLLGIHYFLIGQTLASSHLIDRLLGYVSRLIPTQHSQNADSFRCQQSCDAFRSTSCLAFCGPERPRKNRACSEPWQAHIARPSHGGLYYNQAGDRLIRSEISIRGLQRGLTPEQLPFRPHRHAFNCLLGRVRKDGTGYSRDSTYSFPKR